MEKQKYWCLVLDNYHDTDDTIYFIDYATAKANFDKIVELHREHEYFTLDDDTSCSWFDPRYNEYETSVYIIEEELPKIHTDIIF